MKSKMLLVLALLMGLVTTALFYQYTKKFEAKETTAAAPMAEIVVAKEKINKNEKIAAEKLQVILVPESTVLAQSIKSISEAEGKRAESMIEKSEPILTHRLLSQQKEAAYVSRKVQEGYRAVSVSVDLPRSVTNLIEPEDQVDVIFSKGDKTAPEAEQPQVKSTVLLEKVRVLAVGRKMVVPEDSKEPYAEYSALTFELKPDDAIKLIEHSQEGTFHFVLRTRPAAKEDGSPVEKTKNES